MVKCARQKLQLRMHDGNSCVHNLSVTTSTRQCQTWCGWNVFVKQVYLQAGFWLSTFAFFVKVDIQSAGPTFVFTLLYFVCRPVHRPAQVSFATHDYRTCTGKCSQKFITVCCGFLSEGFFSGLPAKLSAGWRSTGLDALARTRRSEEVDANVIGF
jgi:hypothetical protein